MSSPGIIRTALQTRLATIAGLRIYAQHPSQLNLPCAILTPVVTEPEQTFGRGDLTRYDLDCTLYTNAAAGLEQAQSFMDPYLATSSTGGVFGAIAADRTLGGVVSTVFVQGLTDYGIEEPDPGGSLAYLRATVRLTVWST